MAIFKILNEEWEMGNVLGNDLRMGWEAPLEMSRGTPQGIPREIPQGIQWRILREHLGKCL